ncbi:chitinase-like protein EN03 isoform X2 [Chrysoperla carnea]|uniref:chitinase-like protein EN03 isoform X2 n=1 Tax=Chrysoperla carnea TaxID=189513 RepID=UPI001D061116|nr:chitinase-like protein EN03 isoform X2 [Chrysoperla carnea]
MRSHTLALGALLLLSIAWATNAKSVVCYYNSKGFHRDGQAKFRHLDFDAALPYCTHLIYGYAGIEADTHKITSLDSMLDLPAGNDNYRAITKLKSRFPALKILLSVGGNADTDKSKYLSLLESAEARTSFVNSAFSFIRVYGFDGLDLAWEFPETKPKRIRGTFGSIWHGIKKTFGTTKIDDNEEAHREQFADLVRQTRAAFKPDKLMLTVSVIPNVNNSIYFDVRKIIPEVDQVHLLAYDYYTPERNPKEADYSAPLYELIDRKPDANANAAVRYWLDHGAPATKIILGIPTHARTFKMTSDSVVSGVPPLTIDGPGEAGAYTKEEGLLSYAEVCTKINSPVSTKGAAAKLRKIGDPTKRYGCYAFRLPDENEEHGIWVSYEDPDVVKEKATYAKHNGLGGIAFNDLTLDDFKGLCTTTKYPLLIAGRSNL